MSKQQWVTIGIIAAIAVLTGFLVKRKSDKAASDASANSQLPADEAAANYNVPPNIGVSENAPTGISFPGDKFTMTTSQANALPVEG